ncbi:MAG: Formamidopyrimidine-DNA glycosylase (Fapy-DNA glycosylase) [candidate division WWE3 bacterium GW2011_GWC1_47_10]|uniref:Formamidopyrimidine-DNA glycosylase (Fapy-DNA glycosylase) n=1 Tax=candidate division WWE3 bacterium GW2011_GWC1_47_10 TaxID=1619122 RepID=A0A0G1QYA7_UNCKA|nr:MAG: Formamidopyrimidine-DNA glycosylase (Fapy-DNA glycosylase) [candidate division WWE3 bacterium GW2011_GWC1_47_10]
MPELPEIITIRNDLQKELVGKRIVSVEFAKNYKTAAGFAAGLENTTVVGISNVAKLIVIHLSNKKFIASHLNMSGLLLYNAPDQYVKIALAFDTRDKLYYSDTRLFGYFECWDEVKLTAYKKRHGTEALDQSLTPSIFANTLKKRKTSIKAALMDQTLISGIGNIYANDSLFMSCINPWTKTTELTDARYKMLLKNIREVLSEGVTHRGSSIDRYRDIYNKPGTQQNHFRIYGKAGRNCNTCGTRIVFEKIQGRSTYICPKCQPK